MSGEWIRFGITAALLILGYVVFAAAVIGVWRFGYVMNRMHASGAADTLGLLSVAAAVMVSSGSLMTAAKLAFVVAVMWFSSPASTHFLAQVEYFTNSSLEKETELNLEKEESSPAGDITHTVRDALRRGVPDGTAGIASQSSHKEGEKDE